MKAGAPRVSVVMPVYNGEKHLAQAIDSVLGQTFGDFELIIVDDGSTDGTAQMLAGYGQRDQRVRVYHQENQGVTVSRNAGCRVARGEYIAVLDADDVSLPQRLERQVRWLDAHSGIGVLGSWIDEIDSKGVSQRILRWSTAAGIIRWSLICGENYICHSSVMMRRDLVADLGFYRPEVRLAEDYDLWSRASLVTQIAIIPEVLVRYRVWEENISSRRLALLDQYAVSGIRSTITRLLGIEVSEDAARMIRFMGRGLTLQETEQTARLLHRLYVAYRSAYSLTPAEARGVRRSAARKLYKLALGARRTSLSKSLAIFLRAARLDPRLLVTLVGDMVRKGWAPG